MQLISQQKRPIFSIVYFCCEILDRSCGRILTRVIGIIMKPNEADWLSITRQ
jgi:hypothetical protein